MSLIVGGKPWKWVQGTGAIGTRMPHWERQGAEDLVEVYPPDASQNIGWSLSVDGLEILELKGRGAREMVFAAGHAFARQKFGIRAALRTQRIVRKHRPHTARSRQRHHK